MQISLYEEMIVFDLPSFAEEGYWKRVLLECLTTLIYQLVYGTVGH